MTFNSKQGRKNTECHSWREVASVAQSLRRLRFPGDTEVLTTTTTCVSRHAAFFWQPASKVQECEIVVTVVLPPELERTIIDRARLAGTSPQDFVLKILNESLATFAVQQLQTAAARGRALRDTSVNCGVSLSDEAVSSEGLYD